MVVSIYWNQDGFNFDIAGDSGYKTLAIGVGWFLAISTTVLEFIFSSGYKDLNMSLKLFGIAAYVYSIYTNYGGILHFQGSAQNKFGAGFLGFLMDAVPEPMIAWGLYESLAGDFVGNLVKTIVSAPSKVQQENKQKNEQNKPIHRQSSEISSEMFKKLGKRGHSLHGVTKEKKDDEEPRNRYFGE